MLLFPSVKGKCCLSQVRGSVKIKQAQKGESARGRGCQQKVILKQFLANKKMLPENDGCSPRAGILLSAVQLLSHLVCDEGRN